MRTSASVAELAELTSPKTTGIDSVDDVIWKEPTPPCTDILPLSVLDIIFPSSSTDTFPVDAVKSKISI